VIREKGRYMGWLLILEQPFRKKSLALPVRAITGVWLGLVVEVQQAFDGESARDCVPVPAAHG
jgi:hypothetical protein